MKTILLLSGLCWSMGMILTPTPSPIPTITTTVTPESPQTTTFRFEFPLQASDEFALTDARDCVLIDIFNDATEPAEAPTTDACRLANQALNMAQTRGSEAPVTVEEQQTLAELAAINPALLLRLPVIATYYSRVMLVAPPTFTDQPITAVHLVYHFAGLGNAVSYDVTISAADTQPVISGTVDNGSDSFIPASTHTPASTPVVVALPETIDAAVLQAFAPALGNLIPIGQQFSSVVCYDYYPDWTVTLTFADHTEIIMQTNNSNVIGVGGPWQTEIDGQQYLQYSSVFAAAAVNLLDTLDLPLGETAAMTCTGGADPLTDAYPLES